MAVELNTQEKIVLPNSSTKKNLQLVNGKLVIVNYDGTVSPIASNNITNVTENKIDLNSLIIKHFDERFNSLLPIIDSKSTKEELVLAFKTLQDEIKNDLIVLKDYTDLSIKETKSNVIDVIETNKAEIDSEVVDIYDSITSINDDFNKLIDSINFKNSITESDLKLINDEIKIISDDLNNYKDYIEKTFVKKSELPVVPVLIEGKNIKLTETSEGNIIIDAIVPKYEMGYGGGASQSKVSEMIAAALVGFTPGGGSGSTNTGSNGVINCQRRIGSGNGYIGGGRRI